MDSSWSFSYEVAEQTQRNLASWVVDLAGSPQPQSGRAKTRIRSPPLRPLDPPPDATVTYS
jgi:hypothetical protein